MAIILAAGKGTRMKTSLPKVMHRVCGKPIVSHVVSAVRGVCEGSPIVVVGEGKEQVIEELEGQVRFAVQDSGGYGTGYAVISAREYLEGREGAVIVAVGDTPLVRTQSFEWLSRAVLYDGASCAMLTADVDNPFGYGRIVRDHDGSVEKIVEQKDLQRGQEHLTEINASIYCFDIASLLGALSKLSDDNAAHEYYLTDVISILRADGKIITAKKVPEAEIVGINDHVQLYEATVIMRRQLNMEHMRRGVTLIDAENTYIDADVSIGEETIIYPGCVLEKGTVIGEGVTLLPGCHIVNAVVGDNTTVGPYAYLRPNTRIGANCRIGDFVEVKNSDIGDKTKISHLTYIGDSDLGEDINIGCGVVTVNYDGKHKHRTKVESGAFVGCNVNLVAPVTVNEGAYIAAGTTITRDVPARALAIGRARQENKPGWVDKREEAGKL